MTQPGKPEEEVEFRPISLEDVLEGSKEIAQRYFPGGYSASIEDSIVYRISSKGVQKPVTIIMDTVNRGTDDMAYQCIVDIDFKKTRPKKDDVVRFSIDFLNYFLDKIGYKGIVDQEFSSNWKALISQMFMANDSHFRDHETGTFRIEHTFSKNLLNISICCPERRGREKPMRLSFDDIIKPSLTAGESFGFKYRNLTSASITKIMRVKIMESHTEARGNRADNSDALLKVLKDLSTYMCLAENHYGAKGYNSAADSLMDFMKEYQKQAKEDKEFGRVGRRYLDEVYENVLTLASSYSALDSLRELRQSKDAGIRAIHFNDSHLNKDLQRIESEMDRAKRNISYARNAIVDYLVNKRLITRENAAPLPEGFLPPAYPDKEKGMRANRANQTQ